MENIKLKEVKISLKAGKKYSICSCGLSNSLPFCDNNHREYNSKNNTQYKSVKIVPEKNISVKIKSSNWKNLSKI